MPGFDANTWYVLRNAANTTNNTLTAGTNTQAAFDPNSPSAIYYAPGTGTIANSQLWQLSQINTSSSSAYVLRSRQIGSSAYLTSAETTRKCGGGKCATVPILSPDLDDESLWQFGSWGWSDPTGGAYIYNLGNGSIWRLDAMDDGVSPEILNYDDTGRLAQHWTVSAYTTFAASDSSAFNTIPATATALLAQYVDGSSNGSTASITPYTGTAATSTSAGTSNSNSPTGSSSGQLSGSGKSGLSSGAAAGIGVGAACLFFIICGILGFFCYRRRKSRKIGTKTNPAELTHPHEHPVFVNTPNEKANYVEMPTTETMRSPVANTEMPHPSDLTRSEMMHPTESSRTELEHPSTRMSGTWNSTPTQVSGQS